MKVKWNDWHAIAVTDLDVEHHDAVGAEITSPGGAYWRVWRHKDGRWFATIGHGGDETETEVRDRDHGILVCERHIYQVTLENVMAAVAQCSDGRFCRMAEHMQSFCECDERREHIERAVGTYLANA